MKELLARAAQDDEQNYRPGCPAQINVGEDYREKYGFFDPDKYVFKAKRGLSEEIVREISWMRQEPTSG